MLFLGIGIVLLLMKALEVGSVAEWSWLAVLSPFALAVVWWTWSDWSGLTKRKAVEKMEKRKQDRIDKQRAAIGLGPKKAPRR